MVGKVVSVPKVGRPAKPGAVGTDGRPGKVPKVGTLGVPDNVGSDGDPGLGGHVGSDNGVAVFAGIYYGSSGGSGSSGSKTSTLSVTQIPFLQCSDTCDTRTSSPQGRSTGVVAGIVRVSVLGRVRVISPLKQRGRFNWKIVFDVDSEVVVDSEDERDNERFREVPMDDDSEREPDKPVPLLAPVDKLELEPVFCEVPEELFAASPVELLRPSLVLWLVEVPSWRDVESLTPSETVSDSLWLVPLLFCVESETL
jgi:hypothetical protein